MTLQKLAAFSLALGLAVPTVVEGSEISHSDWSVGTPLDTRGLDGTRLAAAEERIAYDPQWGNAESCSLDANGTRILSGGEAGVVPWSPTGPGLYRLTHTAGNVTYTARFAVPGPETTVVEADRLETNAVWHTGGVYLVTGTVTVPGGVTLTIESGAIVKFMPGARLAVEAGATCLARGVVFTHAYDDAAGGDTLFDGAETTPVVNDYELTGTITDDETTEYRYTAPLVLSGTISSNMRWRGWKLYHVTGDLTVASGVTLTIEPGAVVKFDAGRSLTVAGGATLDAQGTRAQPIVFTSIKDDGHGGDTNGDGDKTQPQPGDWARINANGTVKMNHCRLYYCSDTGDRGAIQGGGGTVTFDNGEIAHTTYECVRMNSGTFVSHNSVFRDSSMGFGYFGGSGTYVYNGVVADCTIACRASNKHFVNTVFYNCLTFLESTSSSADHCAFYNPPDWGAQTATQVGKNGNIWGDPLFVDPANGDFRIREGSPCVDAADSSAAPELDYFGQPRITFTGRTNDTELAEGPLADIGICEVMPRDVTSDIDLVPESVRTEATATPGQLLFVKWEVRNQGGTPVGATWRDTVSLVSRDGREVVLGDKMTKSAIAVGGSVFCSGYFTVPAMAEGTWYPKMNVNSYHDIFEGSLTANNALVGTGGVEVAVKEVESEGEEGVINAGAPTVKKITLPETGGNRMVRIKVPAGVTIRWGFGFVPTGNQKSGTLTSNGQDVLFRVPDGVTDVYVSMESDDGAEYDLSLEEGQVVITGVSPNTLPSSGRVRVTANGAGFDADTRIALVNGGTRVSPAEMAYVDENTLVATYDCSALVGGAVYDCEVTGGNGMATLENSVTVSRAEGKGVLELSYDIPKSVRAGRIFTFTVTCKNVGTADLCCPIITVEDTESDTEHPLSFSLDGKEFTDRCLQFVSKDANGGFDGFSPNDVHTFAMYAKMPVKHSGAKSLSVRANTENDTASKYQTEIDRYLTLSLCTEYSSDLSEESVERWRSLRQLFGNTNGEMVKNFSRLARVSLDENGYSEQIVSRLVLVGMNRLGRSTILQNITASTLRSASRLLSDQDISERRYNESVTVLDWRRLPVQTWYVNSETDVYIWNGGWQRLRDSDVDLESGSIAVLCHGLRDSIKTGWMSSIASVLESTNKFKYILGVNWEKEAFYRESAAYVTVVAKNIYPVSQYIRTELSNRNFNFANATFIGHSFGSHLLGIVSNGHGWRHIGLDTANTKPMPERSEIKSHMASRMEYYRSSPLYGRDDTYADENYIVCDEGGFYVSASGNGDLHSYACTWFARNVVSSEAQKNGVGFWRAYVNSPIDQFANSSKVIGVVNGNDNKYECLYPYTDTTMSDKRQGFKYPGNKSGWTSTLRTWSTVADYRIQFDSSFRTRFKIGVPKNIGLTVHDDADIKTCKRYHQKRILIYFRNGRDGYNRYVKDVRQDGSTFNFDITIPKNWIDEYADGYYLKFIVSHGSGALNEWVDYEDLYVADNVEDIPITFEESYEPVAIVNDKADNGFVLTNKVEFKSWDDYVEAREDGDTIDFKFKGNMSIGGGDKKIKAYVWHETTTDTKILGNKSTLTRTYLSATQARYPITLTVVNELNETSTVTGFLDIIPVYKKTGEPIEVPQSIDPNEMVGPVGLGDPETERYVKPGEWMTYTVYFENRADATAAAQEVRVTNPLSEYLDWSTFEMGEVAFNNQIDLGLSGKRSGTSEAVMKGTNTLVRTQLTLNEKTGIAEWYLRIVDPTTATGWPEDVFAGFLPPNDETFRGEGHLTYRVKVRDDAPHGVRIDNSASIVFDYNEPIETDPSWWNTVARTLEAGFVEPEVAVDEGGTVTVSVRGGSAERAVSVQVYLAYQTASAADLDLKNAAVDGATPKGGLRFPLTLSWAAGEIGAKTLTIPVKADRAVENEELFTLQLANAQGMGVGDASYCTVTVRDANAAADYAARQGKTTVRTKKGVPDCALSVACVARDGSDAVCGYTTGQGSYYAGCRASLKATARPGWAFAGWGEVVDGVTNVVGTKAGWTVTPTNDTEIVALFERIPYVRALADPADGGKVSGSGYCAAGKKVALKATASRNFTFAGWYAAGAPDAPVATTPTLVLDRSAKSAKGDARQTVLTDVDGDATYFARFVGDPEVSVAVSATDGRGAEPAGKGAGRYVAGRYVAGTVTGAGRYAPGKKAVLKATANRGYVFAGWREAGADGTLSRSAAYTIGAMPPDDVALVAAFVTADEDRESVAASLGGLPLAPWVSKTETHALATNVRAGVYLEWPLAASALSETTVKVAGLPAGLRFAAKPVTSRSGTGRSAVLVTNVPANTVYGAPTAASRTVTDRRTGAVTVTPSAVKVTVTTAGRSSRTYQIDTTVDPLPAWAQGTFAGVSYADADGAETNGLAAVSVTAAGKVSARQTAAGRAASFTAPWYDRHDAAEDAYHATLTAKVGAAVVTNRVTVRAAAHAATDAVPAETALGVMRGDLLDAWQTDWRREPWKGFAAALARARPPLAYAYEVAGDQPGTVALKFGANGAVTAAGTFATGVDARGRETTAKASCSATLLPQGGDRYLVFVYFPPKGAFRGHARCLVLAWDGAGFVEDVAW